MSCRDTSGADWVNREAESLFHEIADLDPADREVYYKDRQIAPELRAQVEQLLTFDRDRNHVLTGSVAASAQLLLDTAAQAEGKRCGPYRLIRLIGRGGMGSVYLAERTDGEIQQRVAIKLLSRGAQASGFVERFLRERQILASLNHPGIARLLDAGHTDDGRPYLAMEYIDGAPIDLWAEKQDLRPMLLLFAQVCEAVSYAHRNLIVHRDLKPSNILVNNSGEPKLLDFGIAKMLDATADQTATRDQLLTPEYASPEQIRGTPQTVTSDIYSLGAVLYKLLTGRSPHSAACERRTGIEFAICFTDPEPPSTIRRAIPRDLDYISAKALRKEPGERYGSADALADDIRAFLESRPVRARSGNAWYRARKFLRRYWVPAMAAALVVVSLAAGLYAANRERAIAQRRFTDLRQLSNKLFDIDVQVRDLPGSTRTRQLIVDTALEYLRRLAANVRGDPELTLEVGNAYMRVARVQGVPISPTLGQTGEAEQNLQIAQKFVGAALRAQPGNRTAMLRLAQIAHDQMILARFKGNGTEALAWATRSAEWLDRFHAAKQDGAEASGILNTYLNVADEFNSGQRYEDALRLCRRASELARMYNRPAHLGNFERISAQVYRARGDREQAIGEIRQSVKDLDPGPDRMTRGGQTANFQLSLVEEGKILGETNAISLGRTQEAVAPLDEAFRIADEFVHRDANDHGWEGHLGSAAIPLGAVLAGIDARRSLEVYDHALRHLSQIGEDIHLARYKVELLTGSTDPLRRLQRLDEAGRRLDLAFAVLQKIHFYPAEKIYPDSELEDALRARADYEAARGDVSRAAAEYHELLGRIQRAKPGLQPDLNCAVDLSLVLRSAAEVYRRSGQADAAGDLERQRRELWRSWDHRLPGNTFVQHQRAEAQSN